MPNEDELSCQQVVELVTDYLENALLPEMRTRLEAHVAGCPGCKNFIEQMQLTIDLLHQIGRTSTFPATKQELVQMFAIGRKILTSGLDLTFLVLQILYAAEPARCRTQVARPAERGCEQ